MKNLAFNFTFKLIIWLPFWEHFTHSFLRCQSLEPPICDENNLPQYNQLCYILKDVQGPFGACVQQIRDDPDVRPTGVSSNLFQLVEHKLSCWLFYLGKRLYQLLEVNSDNTSEFIRIQMLKYPNIWGKLPNVASIFSGFSSWL